MEGKDTKGRFLKGHNLCKGNPGGQYALARADFMKMWKECTKQHITYETMSKILLALVDQAEKGDLAAINSLLDRLLGKPAATMKLDVDANVTTETKANPEAVEILRDIAIQYASRSPN